MIKIKDYLKLKDFSKWKEIYVDPGVYELTKHDEYSWVKVKTAHEDMIKFLDFLPKNHYFSWDYPCDMNPKFTEYFLRKSWKNAKKYCKHSQYIITVQSKCYKIKNRVIPDELSFYKWFDRYNKLEIKSGILGIGNLCRIKRMTVGLKNIIIYAMKNSKHPRMHIYGLCLDAIPFAEKLAIRNNIELSIDSTKWTRACNSDLKWSEGYNCTSKNRQKFFDEYLNIIKKRDVELENE